jgi:hypothetical protein
MGNLVKSFAMVIFALFAAIASLGFYETLSALLISRASQYGSLIPWLPAISFLAIYFLIFAVLWALLSQIPLQHINFGKTPELVAKIIGGIIAGIFFSGSALIFLALAPLPTQYSYQRFDPARPSLQKASKVLLNTDGFVSWLFAKTSGGGLSPFMNKKSFASFHPDFLDQIYLNKIGLDKQIPIISATNEIVSPAQNGVWLAPQSLTDAANNPVTPPSGSVLTVVRVGFKRTYSKGDKFSFNIAQVRLICKSKAATMTGTAQNCYPVGYLKTADKMVKTDLNYKFDLKVQDMEDNLTAGTGKWIDFVFEVPGNLVPFAVEFRQNSIAQAYAPVTADKAPQVTTFIPSSECARDLAEIEPAQSAKIYGIALTSQNKLLEGLSLKIDSTEQLRKLIIDNNNPPKIESNKILYAVLKLKSQPSTENQETSSRSQGLSSMLKVLDGYSILALKCNNPAAGSAITPADLPALIDLNEKPNYPVGLLTSGKSGNDIIYQFDYCATVADKTKPGLKIDENGNVSKPFPQNIWITNDKVIESINEFYLLYFVKSGMIITRIQPAGSKNYQTFKGYQGFSTR